MKTIKIIAAVLAGLAVSLLLYYASIWAIVTPLQKSSGREPEAYMGLVFVIIMPACLLIGSVLSGYYLRDTTNKQSVQSVILRSPGLYYGVFTLIPILLQAGSLLGSFVIFMVVASFVGIGFSAVGTVLGGVLKMRKSNQAL